MGGLGARENSRDDLIGLPGGKGLPACLPACLRACLPACICVLQRQTECPPAWFGLVWFPQNPNNTTIPNRTTRSSKTNNVKAQKQKCQSLLFGELFTNPQTPKHPTKHKSKTQNKTKNKKPQQNKKTKTQKKTKLTEPSVWKIFLRF